MEKLAIREAIVVEGRYDKAAVARVADTLILDTNGFGIFSDREKLALLRRLARERGLIVLTDSDGGGTLIRRFLKQALDPRQVRHAYIPEIAGRERRKRRPSKEGKLGVEGMSAATLEKVLLRCGATLLGQWESRGGCSPPLTKAEMYAMGLSGTGYSAQRRTQLLKALDFPASLPANALLELLNALVTREELSALLTALPEEEPVSP